MQNGGLSPCFDNRDLTYGPSGAMGLERRATGVRLRVPRVVSILAQEIAMLSERVEYTKVVWLVRSSFETDV